jgi:guanylate kinase
VEYFFVERPAFRGMVDRGEFLEWAEYQGELYGTTRAFVEQEIAAGKDVILDIDVQGALQVKQRIPEARAIFILPPSFPELQRRLKGRKLETDEAVQRRLEAAKKEIRYYRNYDYIVINDVLENAIRLLECIVRSGAAAPAHEEDRIEEIIASFGGSD